jgi:hypothetical protein
MTGTCQFSYGGHAGSAAWAFDGSSLIVTPDDGAPLDFTVKELTGVSGDDYSVAVEVPGKGGEGARGSGSEDAPSRLVLSRLGHDGPTLAESLRREWLLARTDVLRLGGSGDGWLLLGQVDGLGKGLGDGAPSSADGAATGPFRALFFEDVLAVAREGRDVEPVFLALVERVIFDEATYEAQLDEWPGRKLTFSKLAKQTDEFLKRLKENRAVLAQEAATTLAAAVPGLPASGRAALSGAWLPGRLMQLPQMDGLCSGFEAAFRTAWLPGLLRHEEGGHLMEWASSADTWMGCTRESSQGGAGGEGAGGGPEEAARPLWMLAGKKGVWFLEALTMEDRATYCFKGRDEVPALVSRLLCAPQFSKEALYSPLAELTGERADLAIPARHLGFLGMLRTRFNGRLIHQSLEGWRKEFEKLGR